MGRTPKQSGIRILAILIAPFYIIVWNILHPKKFYVQAKKELADAARRLKNG